MFYINDANDFEFYSANSAGGIQGYEYQCRNAGYVLHAGIVRRIIISYIP